MTEPVKILLVEDNPAHVRLTQERLADTKLVNALTIARDGEEALRCLGVDIEHPDNAFEPKEDYGLIIVDLNLPILDGRDLIDIIRQNIKLARIPLIIMTSSLDDREIMLEHRLPPAAYIEKPIDKANLYEALKAYPALAEYADQTLGHEPTT